RPSPIPPAPSPLAILDPAVRDAIEAQDPHAGLAIRSLQLDRLGWQQVRDLHALTNLERLDLSHNYLALVTDLGTLHFLNCLILDDNPISIAALREFAEARIAAHITTPLVVSIHDTPADDALAPLAFQSNPALWKLLLDAHIDLSAGDAKTRC
ncbi:MAG: hypothetical protein ABI743_11240, partial [bacterium]